MPGVAGSSRNAKMNAIGNLVKAVAGDSEQLGGQVLLMKINAKLNIWDMNASSWVAPELKVQDLECVIPEFISNHCRSMETLLLLLNEAR